MNNGFDSWKKYTGFYVFHLCSFFQYTKLSTFAERTEIIRFTRCDISDQKNVNIFFLNIVVTLFAFITLTETVFAFVRRTESETWKFLIYWVTWTFLKHRSIICLHIVNGTNNDDNDDGFSFGFFYTINLTVALPLLFMKFPFFQEFSIHAFVRKFFVSVSVLFLFGRWWQLISTFIDELFCIQNKPNIHYMFRKIFHVRATAFPSLVFWLWMWSRAIFMRIHLFCANADWTKRREKKWKPFATFAKIRTIFGAIKIFSAWILTFQIDKRKRRSHNSHKILQ